MKCDNCQKETSHFCSALNQRGGFDFYCEECYSKVVLDNFPERVEMTYEKDCEPSCECGTKNSVGQGHSQWCQLYKKEFN
jgi:hypothetical protein